MGLIARYRTWKVMHLLNKIPYLLSKEQFEHSDRLLQEASRVYGALPDGVRKQKIQLEDLFIEMKKLLGGEFRRKLDKQLGEERVSRISLPTVSKKIRVDYGKNVAKKYLAQKRQQLRKETVQRSLKKIKNVVSKNPRKSRITEWKKQGYDTSLVEKNMPKNNPMNDKLKDLQNKISEWKKQGYNTAMLEKQLSSLKR